MSKILFFVHPVAMNWASLMVLEVIAVCNKLITSC